MRLSVKLANGFAGDEDAIVQFIRMNWPRAREVHTYELAAAMVAAGGGAWFIRMNWV